jgi:hypothetical protein
MLFYSEFNLHILAIFLTYIVCKNAVNVHDSGLLIKMYCSQPETFLVRPIFISEFNKFMVQLS